MSRSIQDSWDKFERWKRRYKRVCERIITESIAQGMSDFDGGLFLENHYELDHDIFYEVPDEDTLRQDLDCRIENKMKFLQGYLVDISFDRAEAMAQQIKFLSCQYPSRCNSCVGIWLEQDLEGEVEAGAYFGFQGFDASFFCTDIGDVNLASMRTILPFDRMFLRLPKGRAWDEVAANNAIQQVNDDIGSEYSGVTHVVGNKTDKILSLAFDWN